MFSGVPNGPLRLSPPQVHAAVHNSGGNLRKKVDGLAKKGIVVPTDAEILHNLRFFANESAHEAAAHTPEELIIGLNVIEHLLASLYVVPREAKRIPARPAGA